MLGVICTVFCSACCLGDDEVDLYNDEYRGRWSLVNVINLNTNNSQAIEEGVITWSFIPDYSVVDIVNYNEDETIVDFFDTGVYAYGYYSNNIENNECSLAIIVADIDFGCHQREGNTLTFTSLTANGYELTFTR